MNPLTRTLRAYAADARSALRDAPVEIVLGLLMALLTLVATRTPRFTEEAWARVAASVALAFPLVFAASVLAARGVVSARTRWAATAAVLAACAAVGGLAIHAERAASWWRWAMLFGAALCALALTPVLPLAARDRRRTWTFVYRTVLRAAGLVAYAGALWLILAGAVAAVVSLFELREPRHLYGDLAAILFFAFVPWVFVGGLPRLVADDGGGPPPALVTLLGRWLFAPVLVIYLAILYAYAVKVAATGELPRNLVSPLVLGAGLVGLIGAVLLEPVHADPGERGLFLLVRWLPALLLPLVPLAAWALLARLGQYGWTEFRYLRTALLLCLGVLAVLGTLRAVRRRPPLFATVPALLGMMLLLGAVGPWSATAVSRRDQTQRLRTALREARIDPRRLPAHSAVVDSALYHRIDGATRYLYQNHGIEAVRRVVPGVPATRAWTLLATDLGLREGCRRRGGFVEGVLEWRGGVQGLAGGTLAPLTVWAPARPGNRGATAGTGTRVPPRGPARGPAFVRTGTDSVAFRLDGNRLHASGPSWTARADAGPLAREIAGGTASACLRVSRPAAAASFGPGAALLVLRDAAGVVRAQVVVTTVQLDIEPAPAGGGPPALSLRWIEGMVVVPARP